MSHEVTNEGHDRSQQANMSKQAKEVLDVNELTVVADRGYYSGEEIKSCKESDIKTYLPRPQMSGNLKKGLFAKRDFIYKPDDNEYECPAGERLTARHIYKEKGKRIRRYTSSSCIRCLTKPKCTTGIYRNINRWEHEEILDELESRMDHEPEMMKVRRSTVEHPYATLKMWMEYTHFQMKTIKRVSAEMSLHILAYNIKRVMNIMGTKALIEAMQA